MHLRDDKFLVSCAAQSGSSMLFIRRNLLDVLAYEDITAPQTSALTDLLPFLNLDNHRLSTKMRKIIQNNSELVLNLTEVRNAWNRETITADAGSCDPLWSLDGR